MPSGLPDARFGPRMRLRRAGPTTLPAPVPNSWRPSPAANVSANRAGQLGDFVVSVAMLDGVADTTVHVVFQQDQRDGIDRRGDRGELVKDVQAVAAVLVHRGDAGELPGRLAQPGQDVVVAPDTWDPPSHRIRGRRGGHRRPARSSPRSCAWPRSA